MLTMLTASALRWMERHRQRAELIRLLEKDERMMRDIGLTRGDIEEALSRPLADTTEPMAEARRLSRLTFGLDCRL